ncbi:hypothetical protein BGZ99_002119 [Dissophora globulifera]|uniref:CYTH domain-containing protein n=1 Tax=Dissophora globulifera TaxID=979702 RepID=A0A9P6RYF5_9FUNG|nr:hypothetical protein BGZ99_002119 [Dissophora globulifera]
MEIEIKIRLHTEEDTLKLERALGGVSESSEDQDNVFFDGAHKELISSRLVFRIRVIKKSGQDPVAVVALKGNAVLVNGIATVEEEEEFIDTDVAMRLIADPNLILEAAQTHRLLNKIVERVPCANGYSHVGRFRNIRHKYQWQGYTVEIDRTKYPHGTAYEIEIESTNPELAKARL